nr:SPOR domain-containing protein [Pararoseomonas indoligenes]
MPAGAPARGGRFVVQLGAVTSEEAAQGEWARLQGRIPELAGRQPQITRVDRGDLPPMWRIRTGGLPDDRAAQALCTSAKSKGAPCAVIGG